MAVPLIRAGAAATKPLRDALGRFTSQAKLDRQARASAQRSLVDSRFTNTATVSLERRQNAWWEQKLGAAPAGQNWVRISTKYAERFGSMIDEMNREI
ncbi:unnamed protein product [marine sediment metagenome]|uniref:Uncharacterized protein n=1 Tax=marine sediment metagenome TaxID=412755 RepID=X0WF20_9ZZZZ